MPDAPRDRSILRLAVCIYAPMGLAILWLKPPDLLRPTAWEPLAVGLGAACGIGLLVILGGRVVSRHTGWGRALHRTMSEALGPLRPATILWLALLSAFGEELLFRGVLHPRMGLWLGAALFAAFHFPYRRVLLPWTAFTFGMGLLLGLLTDLSGSLWPAILLHFMVNHINLHDLAQAAATHETEL
jgi:membrane protease YdiL (CAAX protease family)